MNADLQKGVSPDLLATSGDYLRVWRVADTETRLECLLNNVRINVNVCSICVKKFKFGKIDEQSLNLR